MEHVPNRWLIVLAAVAIHICIGSVYAWSVYANHLLNEFAWSLTSISLVFSIAIVFLGLSAAIMGHFVEKHGPRKSGLLAALFFGIGIIGSGIAINLSSLSLLYLTYGVMGGIGLGIGYITPVSALVKWFPDNRGLATGLAIMGFGFGAVVSGPLQEKLMTSIGIAETFFILGGAYLIIMLVAASFLQRPPEGWKPLSLNTESGIKSRNPKTFDLAQLTANEAVKERRFWFLWLMLFINVTCGIAVLSVAAPMAIEIAGFSMAGAALLVGIMGFFNGCGRFVWATVSDYIGRPNVYTTFFVIEFITFLLLPNARSTVLFSAVIFVTVTCYGGGFACIPAYIGDLFGTKQLGAIHGYILTAWAGAGLVGPYFAAAVRDKTGSYTVTLSIFSFFFVLALLISLWIRQDIHILKLKQVRQVQPQT